MAEDKDGNLNSISEYTSLSIREDRIKHSRRIREMDDVERQRAKEREEINRCSQ
jgi:hypothetical protein